MTVIKQNIMKPGNRNNSHKSTGKSTNPPHQGRGDQTAVERRDNPYRGGSKFSEPTLCPICGLVFHSGRWQQEEPPLSATRHLCPACQRVRDKVPAAQLNLIGAFFTQHRKEIMNLIYNTEAKERLEHPLERIMDIDDKNGETFITFTGVHIANRIGAAVEHAYQGNLSTRYVDRESLQRLTWSRE